MTAQQWFDSLGNRGNYAALPNITVEEIQRIMADAAANDLESDYEKVCTANNVLEREVAELRYKLANFVPSNLRIKELEQENKELRLKVAQLDAFIHRHA